MQKTQQDFLSAIEKFKNFYKENLINFLDSLDLKLIEKIIQKISQAIKNGNNHTLFFFGNGGSYAISEIFKIYLKKILIKHNYYSIKFRSFNFHEDYSLNLKIPKILHFSKILQYEKATKNDLVIFISGSGLSTNILKAVSYCQKREIPVIIFFGFARKIKKKTKNLINVSVPIFDQQIAEDAILAIIFLTIANLKKIIENNFLIQKYFLEKSKKEVINDLKKNFDLITKSFLHSFTDSLYQAYLKKRKIFVVSGANFCLPIITEHIAHNMNWDIIYKIKNPPPRFIFSTPTVCDYTGISNDRKKEGIIQCSIVDKAEENDLILFFSFSNQKDLEINSNIINYLAKKHLFSNTYLISNQNYKNSKKYINSTRKINFETRNSFILLMLSQIIGHMIGRITNLKLRFFYKKEKINNYFKFLINEDLAQRRFINQKKWLY